MVTTAERVLKVDVILIGKSSFEETGLPECWPLTAASAVPDLKFESEDGSHFPLSRIQAWFALYKRAFPFYYYIFVPRRSSVASTLSTIPFFNIQQLLQLVRVLFGMDHTQQATTANSANQPLKTLLDLPNDILLLIIARVPFSRSALRRLRLVCRCINHLTHAKSLYHEIAQIQSSDASVLFCIEPDETNMTYASKLDRELSAQVRLYDEEARFNNFVMPGTFKSILKKGLLLLRWLCHHAIESPNKSTIAHSLLQLAEDQRLDFTAMLAIKIAIVCMFDCLKGEPREREPTTDQINAWPSQLRGPEVGEVFLAFETAILWSRFGTLNRPSEVEFHECAVDGVQAILQHMVDPLDGLSHHMKKFYHCHYPDLRSSYKLWAIFSSLLKDKASSNQRLNDLLGPDSEDVTDIDLYYRIKDSLMQKTLAEEVLSFLDLSRVARKGRLKGPILEFPVIDPELQFF